MRSARGGPGACGRIGIGIWALTSLSLAACDGGTRSTESLSTVTVHSPQADEWLFGPAQTDEQIFLMFQPLVQAGRDGEIEGKLAREWEHSADRRHWTVHLRTDVRWHDGVPFTAHDVAFTANLLMHPEVARVAPGAFTVSVVDDGTYTVDIHTNDELGVVTPSGTLTLAGIYFPKHLLEGLDPARFFEWEFWVQPIGNGPYRYVRHIPNTLTELEANPDFFLGRPAIDRVVFKFGAENKLLELRSRSVDVALYVEWADLLQLRDDPDLRSYWSKDTNVFMGIMWNVRSGPLADVRVRRALTMAIDRAGLHAAINLPEDTPVFDGVFTERQYWRSELPEALPYDPGQARRLLADAGWTPGRSGMLERDGRPMEITCLIMAEDAINVTAAVHVQDRLRDLGVDMQLVPLEPGVLNERAATGDFGAILGEVLTRHSGLARRFGTESYLGYQNDRAIRTIAELEGELDPEITDSLYAELSRTLIEDMPMTALFPDYEMHVVHRRIAGLSTPFRSVALRHMEELWVEDEEDTEGDR
ncbi:MAG: ABC transporter substrate-binding protein [Gemmatimonadota bacterium]|nr:ABC transporter substrate-binding protein [Gemmatimonadota bacterium]